MGRIQLPGGMDQAGAQIERMAQEQAHQMARVHGIRDAAAIQIFCDMVTRRGPTDDIQFVQTCARFAADASMLLPEAMGLCKLNKKQDAG